MPTWKEVAFRYARALVGVMDGIKDHDIQSATGLPQEDCERIANARAAAKALLAELEQD